MAGTKTKQSGLQRLTKFFRETKAELRKVTWPSKDQLVHNTSIIIAFIIIFTVILSVLDFGFQELFGWFANLIG